ncbi:hypothetical protein BKM31_49515 [[Actinomadura] parvosata subsp. kistnae]|uniref:YDG domain-containing protein n=1 Tax=[Actinomadura] parvosata subsp. kistnae TaxID=1909395 RepID=A0A1V0AMA6_9ACTN|nr:hypothetical protein BKM31_49515 [Nonomuraea sp. ATCC 55076]
MHTELRAGISGNAKEGADSIVVSGGYVDDEDYGDLIIYTGHGGRGDSGRQVADQDINARGNAGLVRTYLEGWPVRVIRGAHKGSPHAPATGYQYGGLYRVDSYGSKVGADGFLIWQFKLVRIPDEEHRKAEDQAKETPGPAPVTTSLVQRVVRSSAVVQQIKDWYGHQCQVCGLILQVQGGYYSEGAHIQALGRPYNGPDVVENVLCLCPNDHVRFDNGAIYLSDDLKVVNAFTGAVEGQLRKHPRHRIGLTYVAQHRARWTTGRPRT